MASNDSGPGEQVSMDTSQVKSPLLLGTTGLKQLLQCYQAGTEEIRHTLMQECEVIIECKVCRSLYRGLPNFLCHKKQYCRNQYAGSLVRFQGMPHKEDEAFIFGSSVFTSEDGDNDDDVRFGRRSRRHKSDTSFSQTYNYFKNIDKVGQNMAEVKSTDQVIQLDLIEGNRNAVKQSVKSTRDIPKDSKEPSKKRKAEEQHREETHKVRKMAVDTSDDADKVVCLNGVFSKSGAQNVYSLRQFFIKNNITSEDARKCLKCKTEYASYKSVKSHMKRRHLKRKQFLKCKVCSKLYLHRVSFDQHLQHAHNYSKTEVAATANQDRVEKIVIDNKYVYNAPMLRPDYSDKKRFPVKIKIPDELKSKQEEEDADGEEEKDDDEDGRTSETEGQKQDKRGGYLCTKTFFLAIMETIGIGTMSGSPRTYKCTKHPGMRMKNYNTWREHLLEEHCQHLITCPFCEFTFAKTGYDTKFFSLLGKHLKTSHDVTESNAWKVGSRLRASILNEEELPTETRKEPMPEPDVVELKDEAIVEEASVEEEVDPKPPPVKGTTEYSCIKCDRSFPSFMVVKRHMMMSHGMSNSECNDLRISITEKSFFKPFKPTLRRCPRDMEGGITSTFNLEDFFCPLCTRHYPKVNQVTYHLQANHGCDKEQISQYKTEIKKNYEKRRSQYLQSLTTVRSIRYKSKVRTSDDEADDSGGAEPEKCKRKQKVPAKSNPSAPATTRGQGSSAGKISFGSAFSLQSCSKCQKVFGKRGSLEAHEKECVGGVDHQGSSESSGEEEQTERVTSSTQKVAGPFICIKCDKEFLRRAGQAMHEKTCRGVSSVKEETNSSDSSDDEEDRNTSKAEKKPNILKTMLTSQFLSTPFKCGTCIKTFGTKAQQRSHEKQCPGRSSSRSEQSDGDEEPDKRRTSPKKRKSAMTDFFEKATDENKNCDKTNEEEGEEEGGGSEEQSAVMYKVYKCPLCDIEDLELHRISHHLVSIHSWSSAKVAARRDTLKRSVVFKSCQPHKKPQSPASDDSDVIHVPQSGESSTQSDDGSDTKALSDAALGDRMQQVQLECYSCSLCPKVYPQVWKLATHLQICHGLDQGTIAKMKKEILDKRKQHLTELRGLQRPKRHTAPDPDSASVNSEGSSSQGSPYNVKKVSPKKVEGRSPVTKPSNAVGLSVKPVFVSK